MRKFARVGGMRREKMRLPLALALALYILAGTDLNEFNLSLPKKIITVLFATEANTQLCALLKTALLNEQDVQ